MRALLIANRNDADAGLIGERFRTHGYAFADCHRESPGEWPALDGIDLVLMLGSDWSVYWPGVAAEVAAECALVGEAHQRGTPVFGICFGAQVLSMALGGSVERAPEPEVGWHSIESDVAAISNGPWMQWHYDRVTVPSTSRLVASSVRAAQAFVDGRSVATQFHPEVNTSIVQRWIAMGGGAELTRLGMDPDELVETTREYMGAALPAAEAIVDWFLDDVASGGSLCT